jgi:hypothetical protein
MRLTHIESMDPHLALGLINTALRNDAADLDDLIATHDLDETALRKKLQSIGYAYDPVTRQFRAFPQHQ